MKGIRYRVLPIALCLAAVLCFSSYAATEPMTFDIHTEKQQAYLNDPDPANVFEYAKGAKDYSQPEALKCDFSEDGIGESETYLFQKAGDPEFTEAVTIEDLSEPSYDLYNLKLGEHFYWRGGTSPETIENSPVHEVVVNEQGPRVCRVEGVVNVRDIGGYDSYLAEGGKIRQGLYYRGAKLNSIKKKGGPRMTEELGVKAEIDLRDLQQCTGPYVDGTQYYPIPIPSGTEETRFEEFAQEYVQIFDVISRANEAPVYLHCSAGADRTGLVSFILLTVLGADYEDIARDYMFTNFADQGKREIDEFNSWWEKLEAFEGDTMADKAASWLMSKGVPEEQIETIRTIFVEGYGA